MLTDMEQTWEAENRRRAPERSRNRVVALTNGRGVPFY